jgi:uncharacterized protein YjdB
MYKVLPGTYYVKAREWRSNINGYGTLTVNTVPIADDPGGEPNDKILLAKNIQLNTQYTALTGYHGHKDENNNFNQDFKDYYKFSVPANNYAVTLDISRANTNIEMDLQARIVDKNGYQIGQNISLRNASSDRIDISFSEAGTYYLFVDSWPANYQSTEYTFKLTGTNPTTITMRSRAQIGKGQTIKLNPVISPATPARTITWRSSNTSVATVETNGTVKGINSGTATITATVNGVSNVSASCVITVKQPVKSVKIKKSVKLKRGKTYVLAVKIKPADATNKNVKWKSSNKKVASVSKGVIRAKKKGRAVITVTTNDGKKKAKCKVRVTK